MSENMYVETFPVGMLGCNCSIIADPKTGDAIIVDPGDDALDIISRVKKQGFSVRYLLHTHAHIDHVSATAEVKTSLGGRVCLHREDTFLYDNLAMQAQFLRMVTPKRVDIDHYLQDKEEIVLSSLKMDVIYTPGHTPGSTCFLWQRGEQSILFSGDTLFQGSIGRTDLWGGDYGQIIASLKEKLMILDDNVIVIPGHGPNTQIGWERRQNPFLQG